MSSINKWLVFVTTAAIFITIINLSVFFGLSTEQKMNIFPDDSFYYLVPALNISIGNGPSSDGINLTSGYHPFWMAVLACVAKVTGGSKNLLFSFSVASGAMLHAIAAVIVYITATGICPPCIAALSSIMYLFCGDALRESIGGTEAAILAFLITFFIFLETKKEGFRILKGILLGCIFLSRTDAFMFVAFLYFFSFIREIFNRGMPAAVKKIGISAIFTLLTVLPWFLISKAVYGTFFQNSMMMKFLWRERLLADMSLYGKIYFSLVMFKNWLIGASDMYPFLMLLISALAGYLVYQYSSGVKNDFSGSQAKQRFSICVAALLCYVVLAGVFYSFRFSFVRSWYFAPARLFWPLTVILLSSLITFDYSLKTSRVISRIITTGLIIVVSYNSLLAVKNYKTESSATNGAAQVVMAKWINNNLPKDAVVGAYSSGILSYFSERRIINLDGLCNNAIYKASNNKTIDEFLDSMKVGYLADHESIILPGKTCGLLIDGNPLFVKNRLKEIHRIKCNSVWGDIVAYLILPGKQ